ncbi:MAG TPA: HAMP domain-containing sensor histidine kinase, partial [Candidatus Nitrosocosmicus sp.]|nr:HAMP domain-containing sensor histidine kinase [Candidatus Nitrosocosmicus sp.]
SSNSFKPIKGTNCQLERTEVIYGTEDTTKRILEVLSSTAKKWDNYTNSQGPSIGMGVNPIRKGFKEAYERGAIIRFITEINSSNLHYCEEFMKIAQLRHIDSAKGGMAVTEKEYIATANLQEAQPVAHLIYSNVMEIVEQQQEVFESLWDKAIPAEERIREIKEGYQRISTKVIDNWNEIYKNISNLAETSEEVLICSDTNMLRLAYQSLFNVYQKIMDKYEKKFHGGIRWIVSVNGNEDIELVRLFMDIGIKIKSIKSLPIINFLVTNKILLSHVENKDGTTTNDVPIKMMLSSTDPFHINYYTSIFEDLWENGIDAKDIIKDIDMGYDPERIDILSKSKNVHNLYETIVRSSKKEIMIIFPSAGAFIRQHRAGLVSSIFESVKNNNIKLKALVPSDHRISKIIQELKADKGLLNLEFVDMEFRVIESFLETKSTVLIVDKRISLVMELKDDSKDTFYDAIGLSTYSSSKAGVLSYVLFFENLWNQTEISMKLKKANKKLKETEGIQNDFIHVAAHELKNPLQPILLMSDVIKSILNQDELQDDKGDIKVNKAHLNELLDIIIRNTQKISKLTNNVLDITRIESNSLRLERELTDIRKFISESIFDFNNQLNIDNNKYSINNDTIDEKLKSNCKRLMLLGEGIENSSNRSYPEIQNYYHAEIDKSRILQVLTNLIDNALKFTELNDQITIIMDKLRANDIDFMKITVKDTGKGIDSEILPKLFSKFATKSENGTGLGLYICKNIIEAHGGQIWAQNNSDEKGA